MIVFNLTFTIPVAEQNEISPIINEMLGDSFDQSMFGGFVNGEQTDIRSSIIGDHVVVTVTGRTES